VTNSPVFQALVSHRLQEANQTEASFRTLVVAELGNPPADVKPPADFALWCESKGVVPCPATPTTVAAYVLSQREPKIGRLLEEIRAISASHCRANLSDPIPSWSVTTALMRLMKPNDVPQGWPENERAIFLTLPADLQRYLIIREKDKEAALKRKFDEIAEQRKLLNETPKETISENPIQQIAVA
jgi:hypothetical protein